MKHSIHNAILFGCVLIVSLTVVKCALATTYYVDNTITDTNVASGTPDFTTYNPSTFATTGGSASVFKTVADINAFSTISPGDFVLFRKGQQWEEQWLPTTSGTAGNIITYSNFGTGQLPKITGGTFIPVTDWTQNGTETIDVSQTTAAQHTNLRYSSSYTYQAQSWKPATNNNVVTIVIELSYGVVAPTSGNVWIEIQTDSSGKPSGTVVTNGTSNTNAANTITNDTAAEFRFNFSTPPSVTSGATYHMVLKGDFSIDGTHYINIQDNTGNPYANGQESVYNGSSWSSTTGSDWYFKAIYSTPIGDGKTYWTTFSYDPVQVLDSTTPLTHVSSSTGMTTNQWYWDSGASKLYINVGGSPSGHTITGFKRLSGDVLLPNNTNYLTFDGFDFDGSTVDQNTIKLDGTESYISILNSKIHGALRQGVLVRSGSSYITISGNEIYNNGVDTIYDHGIYLSSNHSLITNNTSHNNAAFGIQVYDGDGNISDYNTVSYNYVYDNGLSSTPGHGGGIVLSGASNSAIGNLVRHNSRGISIQIIAVNNTVYNNTIIDSITTGLETGATVTNLIYRNNIIYGNTTAVDTTSSTPTQSNNLLTDPVFTNSGSYDYTLSYNSSAIDAGYNVSGLQDKNGNIIYGTQDIGAYEYQPPYTQLSDRTNISGGSRIYSNGKFSTVGTAGSTTAALFVAPTSKSFSTCTTSAVCTQWMDIAAGFTWETKTAKQKKHWVESSTSLGSTTIYHSIGDLSANTFYDVTIDNQRFVASTIKGVEGTYCARTYCKSNGKGKINFTFTGNYGSSHTFDIVKNTTHKPALLTN